MEIKNLAWVDWELTDQILTWKFLLGWGMVWEMIGDWFSEWFGEGFAERFGEWLSN